MRIENTDEIKIGNYYFIGMGKDLPIVVKILKEREKEKEFYIRHIIGPSSGEWWWKKKELVGWLDASEYKSDLFGWIFGQFV